MRTRRTATKSDALAALNYVKALPLIDADSVAVSGCSIGGDVTLELAAEASVPAIVAEEPGTAFITRMHTHLQLIAPERAPRPTPELLRRQIAEFRRLSSDPFEYYTDDLQTILERKLRRIDAPLLIVQGDRPVETDLFLPLQHTILLPAIESAGVDTEYLRYTDAHCFAMDGVTPAGAAAFGEIEAFIRQHIETQPTALDASLVEHVPASINIGRRSIVLPQEVLETYAGTYEQTNESSFVSTASQDALLTIRVQGDQLAAQLGATPPVLFTTESEAVFFGEIGDLEFFRDDEGNVIRAVYRNDLVFERVDEAR